MPPHTQHFAHRVLSLRAERNDALGTPLFAPDGWDLLLMLHTAAEGLPQDTLLRPDHLGTSSLKRWVAALASARLIEQHGQGHGALVKLTDHCHQNLSKLLTKQGNFSAASNPLFT